MTAKLQHKLPTGADRLRRLTAFTARLAGRRLRRKLFEGGSELTHPATLAFMATMKGLPQKLGQHLSMKGDLYPHFVPLLSEGKPVEDRRLFDILQHDLGTDAQTLTALSRVASASLAQVYKGRTHTGADVAVKIKYPDIDLIFANDVTRVLGLAQFIARWLPRTSRSDPEALRTLMAGVGEHLLRELDYQHEARVMAQFNRWCNGHSNVVCPEPYSTWSRGRVLTMSWLEGAPWFDTVANASPTQQTNAVTQLARTYLAAAFEIGVLHADPHPGNMLASGPATDPLRQLALLDFGQVLVRPLAWWNTLRHLIYAARSGATSAEQLARLFVRLEFRPGYAQTLKPVLLPLSQAMLRPFITPGAFDLASWNLGKELEEILLNQPEPMQLELPPALIMLQRTFHGLFFYAQRFDVALDWSRLVPE